MTTTIILLKWAPVPTLYEVMGILIGNHAKTAEQHLCVAVVVWLLY